MQVWHKNNMFISKFLIISSCSTTIVVLVGLYLAVVFVVVFLEARMSAVADMAAADMAAVDMVAVDKVAVGMAVDIGNLVVITAGVGGWFYFLPFPLFSSSAGLPSPHPSPKLSPPVALPPSPLSFPSSPPLSPLPWLLASS